MESCASCRRVQALQPAPTIPNPAGTDGVCRSCHGILTPPAIVARAGRSQILTGRNLLKDLENFPKDDITDATIAKIKKYTDKPEFEVSKVGKQSNACGPLCAWVHAMVIYNNVKKVVEPKEAKLKESMATVAAAQEMLAEKQAELKEVTDRLQALNDDLAAKKKKSDDLVNEVELCKARLTSAQKLITGLSGEKDRWRESSRVLAARIINITGDVLVASGLVAYVMTETALHLWKQVL